MTEGTAQAAQLYGAFIKAQKEFLKVLKSADNPFHKSKYADLASVVGAVTPALNSNGLAILQYTHESDGVAVETRLVHESGQYISGGIFRLPPVKHDAQAYGSALTYARRYSLMAICGIAPEDDDGEGARKAAEETKRTSPKKDNNKEKILADIAGCSNLQELQLIWSKLSNEERIVAKAAQEEKKQKLKASEITVIAP